MIRALHLAYEDPAAPGAGGGSVRTQEINRRLASTGEFDITVVAAAFPGAARRREDGFDVTHIGTPRAGKMAAQLTYFAAIPRLLHATGARYDLVVEDFGAPFSTIGAPKFTATPVVGVVQWLFARSKAQQYKLPFHLVEAAGLRTHRTLIAVSSGMAQELTARAPRAEVHTVLNGLSDDVLARPAYDGQRADFLYLGRLERAQKGLDLLLEAYARVAAAVPQQLLLAGNGPDRQWLERRVDELHLRLRVVFLGHVPPTERFDLLEKADLVVMPSRYESFGMVAAEAAATRTPVAAFDIACLRDLVPPQLLVPAYDVGAYARLLGELAADAPRRRELGDDGAKVAATLSWDGLAAQQAAIYRGAATRRANSGPKP